MKAIVVKDQAVGTAGMKLVERPEPQAAINDVVVQVHASGFVPTELTWPSTWIDRLGRDRTPSILGHELAGVVTAPRLWHDGTVGGTAGVRPHGGCEPADLGPDRVAGTVRARPPSGGHSVLAHGAAGAVGSTVTQLAREFGAYVIGTGHTADRQTVLDFGAQEFVDLDNHALEDIGEVDLVFDVIGGGIGKQSAGLIRAGGTLVSVVGPPEARPDNGLAFDFVVESDPAQLSQIVQWVRDGRLRTNIGIISTLDDAVAAFNPTERRKGKTIIRARP